MTYFLIQFLHVAGALGAAAALALEAAGFVGLRRATVADEARVWLRTSRWVAMVGVPSVLLMLASGIYMSFTRWGWVG